MNLETHQRAAELFARLCDLEPQRQAASLDRLRERDPELARLLAELLGHDRTGTTRLDRPSFDFAPARALATPTRVGTYRIVRRVGAGGMGVVYEAEQDHTGRRVALKLLRSGFATPELLARFEREVRLLARLNHPGIAHVYDAGTADSDAGAQPYFAMEFVQGVALVDFADARRLDTRARVELLARVCDAVHHAHEHGVVHRDLKPSNILVDDDGRPRVLDFGVARAIGRDAPATSLATESGRLVGTLAYMSPEQVEADPSRIDARTDVYALGTIAYELIAGQPPHALAGLPLHAAARVVVERDPIALGAVDRRWRGDLETIVAKALAKERERRYASAAELAADLRRWLADEPIAARPPSASYHVAKFARRNRVLVGAFTVVVVALATGVIVSTRMYFRAETARASEHELRTRAEDTSAALQETNDYFLTLLESPSPWTVSADVKMIDVLDRAAQRIDTAFRDRPKQRAYLLRSLGRTYRGLAQNAQARAQLEEALALTIEQFPEDAVRAAEIRKELSGALYETGDPDGALAQLDTALADPRLPSAAENPCFHATFADLRGRILLEVGRVDEADEQSQRAVELDHGCDETDAQSLRQLRVHVLMARGEYAQAEALCRAELERALAPGGDDSVHAVLLMNTLSALLFKQDRRADAVPWMERALTGVRRFAGDHHPDVASSLSNLGTLLCSLQQFDRGLPMLREALQRARDIHGDAHVDVAITLGNLGAMLDLAGRRDEAIATLREADALFVELLGESSVQRAFTLLYLGEAFERANELDDAREALAQSLAIRRDLLPSDHPDFINVLGTLGRVESKLGSHSAAAEHFDDCYRVSLEIEGDDWSRNTFIVATDLAVELAEAGETKRALEVARDALAYVQRRRADDEASLARARGALGWCSFRAGEIDQGAQALRASVEALTKCRGADDALTRLQRERLTTVEAAVAARTPSAGQ